MINANVLEEFLREAACSGDVDAVQKLLLANVDINSQNAMNGWYKYQKIFKSALHWAAKRNNIKIVDLLLKNGACKQILTNDGKLPCELSTSKEIRSLLGSSDCRLKSEILPIIPHYLENPPLLCSSNAFGDIFKAVLNKKTEVSSLNENISNGELVLKVRRQSNYDSDFIEIELDKNNLTYENLVETCCKELKISSFQKIIIRKLPNTLIRKDKDVSRLQDYQEIEVYDIGYCYGDPLE